MKIKFKEYPQFWKALHYVYVDNVPAQIREDGLEEYECNCTRDQAVLAESRLIQLSDEELFDFCTGEETRMLEIENKYGLQIELRLLEDFFDHMELNPVLLTKYGIKE